MKKVMVIVGVLAFVPVMAAAQSFRAQVEPTVKAVRAQFPPLVNAEQVGEMLNMIAWEHRPNLYLLKKGGGGKCPSPQGPTVSCDILIWAPPGTVDAQTVHIDVFSGASGEGLVSASSMWKSAGACTKRPDSGCEMKNALKPVAPSDIDPGPVDPGEPEPLPSSAVLEQLAELKRLLVAEVIDRQDIAWTQHHEMLVELAALRATVAQLEDRTDSVGEQLRTMTFPCFTATSRVLGTVKLCPVN